VLRRASSCVKAGDSVARNATICLALFPLLGWTAPTGANQPE
jgi:hypothetical protein